MSLDLFEHNHPLREQFPELSGEIEAVIGDQGVESRDSIGGLVEGLVQKYNCESDKTKVLALIQALAKANYKAYQTAQATIDQEAVAWIQNLDVDLIVSRLKEDRMYYENPLELCGETFGFRILRRPPRGIEISMRNENEVLSFIWDRYGCTKSVAINRHRFIDKNSALHQKGLSEPFRALGEQIVSKMGAKEIRINAYRNSTLLWAASREGYEPIDEHSLRYTLHLLLSGWKGDTEGELPKIAGIKLKKSHRGPYARFRKQQE